MLGISECQRFIKDSNVLDRNNICDWTHVAIRNRNTVLQFVAIHCIDRSAVAFLRLRLRLQQHVVPG